MKRKYVKSDEDDYCDSESVTSGSEFTITEQSTDSDSSFSDLEVLSDVEIKNKKFIKKGNKPKSLKKPRMDDNDKGGATSEGATSEGAVSKERKSKKSHIKRNKQNHLATDKLDDSVSASQNSNSKNTNKNDKLKKDNLSSSNISSANSSMELTVNLKSVGPLLKNKHNELVPNSESGVKKYCCYYCLQERNKTKNMKMKIMYAKLADHYTSKHSKEDLIIELMKLEPIKNIKDQLKSTPQKRREEILSSLRYKACHLNNLSTENVEEFVVARRPEEKNENTVAHYGVCFKCFKYLSLTSLHKHVKNCTEKSFKNSRKVKTNSRATIGEYHEIATEGSIQIISCMRENYILDVIKFDSAIFTWLNSEASKYETVPHHFKKTRADLSRLGRLKLEMMNLNENISQLSDIFNEDEYDNFIKACKVLGKYKEVHRKKTMEAPATASDLYHLIQNVANIYSIELGSKQKTERETIKAFIEKLKAKWHSSIGNTIAELQAEFKRHKVVRLPEKDDMDCLRQYLEQEMSTAFKSLSKAYKEEDYLKLRNAIESYIHMTNVKRSGEIEKLTLDDLKRVKIVGNDCRLEVRGKRTKPVPIVFTKLIHTYLECLNKNRNRAHIFKENRYVFASINNTDKNFTYISACKLMREFSQLCGAKDPATLTGTLFRKDFATEGMIKGIDNQGVEGYASYMGHTPRIHNQNYRQGVFQRDIQISKQIRESQTLRRSHFEGNAQVEENDKSMEQEAELDRDESYENIANNNSDTENCNVSSANDRSTNSIVTVKEKKRLQWKQTSIDAFLAEFPHALDNKHPVPSVEAVNAFIRRTKDEILCKRNDAQIRSWIHIQRKRHESKDYIPKRNNIPSYIYSKFEDYIKSEKVPSAKTCAKFLAKSPSKSSVSINDIQTWVKLAIKRRSI